MPASKKDYTYDANGNMTQYLKYDLDESTAWKQEYTYAPNSNITQILGYEWDETASQRSGI